MRILGIIPARGGSKGVPDKNIKFVGEHPLVVHAVLCAKQSSGITDVVVTTDSQKIADVVGDLATVVRRPENLATDTSSVTEAIAHVLDQMDTEYDIIVVLQPTSPLRSGKDIDNIASIFELSPHINSVASVVEFNDIHPARMYSVSEDGTLLSLMQESETARRQDLTPVLFRNGCFYAVRTKAFRDSGSLMAIPKKGYVMDAQWLLNIDTPRDFLIAEVLYNEWRNENSH